MSRNTENREEILKIHGAIDLINQRIDTIENNHLAHMQKDIDRIQYILTAVGLGVAAQVLYLVTSIFA
tara:strand:+ start:44 stop:247 length:204 start_codon:yes stop_codon:yes gene_type:complete